MELADLEPPGADDKGRDVSIIVVSFRTPIDLESCLQSIFVTTEVGDLDVEVIVVDNASGDESGELVRTRFPTATLMELPENVGFGRAVNLAAARACGTYLLLLNSDTVVRPGAVQALVRFAVANPNAGLVGGRTLTVEGQTEPSSCWGRPTAWSIFCFATGLSAAWRGSPLFNSEALPNWHRDDAREVGMVTGCMLLASAVVWERLGGFDGRFFMYGEDTDLSIRAHALGYRPMITPDAEAAHSIGRSSQPIDRRVMIMGAKVLIARKHWLRTKAEVLVRLLLFGVALRAAGSVVSSSRRASVPSEWLGAWRRRREWIHLGT